MNGSMLFHHITRQPLSLGLAATGDLHRRIDREDQWVWQYWVTSLRQHTMSQEEAHYIWRFEHCRSGFPTQRTLWYAAVSSSFTVPFLALLVVVHSIPLRRYLHHVVPFE
jgi:hypothetical protein